MNKKLVKQQGHIPMERFLRDYVRVENEIVIDILSSLSHHNLKLVCEEEYGIRVSRLPFEAVCTEDIQYGDVLLVYDCNRNSAPYKNPMKSEVEDLLNDQPIFTGPFYDPRLTRDEYIDSIENIARNEAISNRQFRLVGTSSKISREE